MLVVGVGGGVVVVLVLVHFDGGVVVRHCYCV